MTEPKRDPLARRRHPTLHEVAAAAGVSIGTVSHVVTGRRRVAERTRARVERAIHRLEYRPNRLARSLLEQRTQTVAMLIPDIGNPFFAELARAVEREARRDGYCVVFGSSENDPETEARYLAEFLERRVDGMVVVSAAGSSWADRLPAGLPAVALDRLPADWQHDAVVVDNQGGVELAVAHLVELGHLRLGFLGGDPTQPTGRQRGRGFRLALARRGLRPAWTSRGSFSLESGHRQTRRMLRRDPDARPTAVVAANDLIALGALLACREAGVSVPEGLSIIGFDDIAFATLADPPLTTVRQPIAELGEHAARLLLERMRHDGAGAERRTLTARPNLVLRGSTRQAAPEARPGEGR